MSQQLRPFRSRDEGAPAKDVIGSAPGSVLGMRIAITSGTETEAREWYGSADLALDAVSSLLAEGRANVGIFDEHGRPMSLSDLRALATFENESDDA